MGVAVMCTIMMFVLGSVLAVIIALVEDWTARDLGVALLALMISVVSMIDHYNVIQETRYEGRMEVIEMHESIRQEVEKPLPICIPN